MSDYDDDFDYDEDEFEDTGDRWFACLYCGQLVLVDRAELWYRNPCVRADGRVLVEMGIYCSPYCGRTHSSGAVSSGVSG